MSQLKIRLNNNDFDKASPSQLQMACGGQLENNPYGLIVKKNVYSPIITSYKTNESGHP